MPDLDSLSQPWPVCWIIADKDTDDESDGC